LKAIDLLFETIGKDDPEIILISGLQVGGLGLGAQPMESVDPMGFCGGQVSGIPDFAYALLESLPEVQTFSNGSYLVPWKMSDFQQKKSKICLCPKDPKYLWIYMQQT
jgi:hypothetical protein